jgi:hypothetical protein
MTKRIILLATALLLAAVTGVAAQSVAPASTVMVEWGAIHPNATQVVAFNVTIGDECSATNVTVELDLESKTGQVLSRSILSVPAGQTITFAMGPDSRAVRDAIGADAYVVLPANQRVLVPCLKIGFPPGPCRAPVDVLTPTMETLDIFTGRLMSFANNPHTTVATLD